MQQECHVVLLHCQCAWQEVHHQWPVIFSTHNDSLQLPADLFVIEDDVTGAREIHEADPQKVTAFHAAAGHVIGRKSPLLSILHHLQQECIASQASQILDIYFPG